jgi:hypothetical protein
LLLLSALPILYAKERDAMSPEIQTALDRASLSSSPQEAIASVGEAICLSLESIEGHLNRIETLHLETIIARLEAMSSQLEKRDA